MPEFVVGVAAIAVVAGAVRWAARIMGERVRRKMGL